MVGGQEAEDERIDAAVRAQLDGLRAQDAATSAALAVRPAAAAVSNTTLPGDHPNRARGCANCVASSRPHFICCRKPFTAFNTQAVGAPKPTLKLNPKELPAHLLDDRDGVQ